MFFAIAFTELPVVRLFQHGKSNPTYFVRHAGRNMVLRKKPVNNFCIGIAV